jgi:hypothetical protein
MGEDFYMSYNISLEAKLTNTAQNKPIVSIRLKLHDKTTHQVVAERERTFTLINGAVLEATGDPNPIVVASPQFLYFGAATPPTPSTNP